VENLTQFVCPHCDFKFAADLKHLEDGEGIMLTCEHCEGDFIVSSEGHTLPFDPEERERLLNDLDNMLLEPPQLTYGETMKNVSRVGDNLDSLVSVNDNLSNLTGLNDDILVEEIEYLLTFDIKFSADLRYLIGKYKTTGRLGNTERAKMGQCYNLAYSIGMRE